MARGRGVQAPHHCARLTRPRHADPIRRGGGSPGRIDVRPLEAAGGKEDGVRAEARRTQRWSRAGRPVPAIAGLDEKGRGHATSATPRRPLRLCAHHLLPASGLARTWLSIQAGSTQNFEENASPGGARLSPMAAVMRFDRRPPLIRHPGLVPGSTLRRGDGPEAQAVLPAARWTPEHVRGDGVRLEGGGLKLASLCDTPL